MKTLKNLTVSLAFMAALSACNTTTTTGSSSPTTTNTIPTDVPSNSLDIITQQSQKAAHAIQVLTKYQQARNATLAERQARFDADKITFSFTGKPADLLESIAIQYGYRFLEFGNKRDLTTVNYTDMYGTPEEVVVNLDAKLGDQADIAINKQDKTITLFY